MKFSTVPFVEVEWEKDDIKALRQLLEDSDEKLVQRWIDHLLTLAMQSAMIQTTKSLDVQVAQFEERARQQQEEISEKLRLIQNELTKMRR